MTSPSTAEGRLSWGSSSNLPADEPETPTITGSVAHIYLNPMSGLSREPDDHLLLTCEHLWPTCHVQVSPHKRGAQAGAGHSCRWTDAQEDPVPKPAGITQTITCRDLQGASTAVLGRHRDTGGFLLCLSYFWLGTGGWPVAGKGSGLR